MLGKSKVKYIQSLGHKKVRDAEGFFIAEGPKIIDELLAAPNTSIVQLYALQEWVIANNYRLQDIEVTAIDESDLAKISQLSTPNKVLAMVKKPEPPSQVRLKGRVSLALDTIQDPGNLGTIIRIADWFGIQQIICNNDCADVYNPKVVQSTMGSIVRVAVIYTDLASWLRDQKDVPVLATALQGNDITAMEKITEGLIVIGNESKGISAPVLERANQLITIPRIGKAESLNAAVATGIILSHLTRS